MTNIDLNLLRIKGIYLLSFFVLLSCFACNRTQNSGCRYVNPSPLKLTEIQDDWVCSHNDYAWTQYTGSFETKSISSDVWCPRGKNDLIQYKELLYCDSMLLEEIDVYFSPSTYLTIDGECNEVLSIGYDYYDKSWRCSMHRAVKIVPDGDSNSCDKYGFKTGFVGKDYADSIKKSWQAITGLI